MSNERPISADEARIVWVRVYRRGREKGGWVYLDADLLREAGMPTEVPLMVKRYALRPNAQGRAIDDDGLSARRGRIILNLAIVTETTEGDRFLTPRRRLPPKSA